MASATEQDTPNATQVAPRLWVERLALTGFRNYASLNLELAATPLVLTGPNGSGKTNVLEAVSLLAPGQGLRQAPFSDLGRAGGEGGWSVSARVHTAFGPVTIGTGQIASEGQSERASGRLVRIDGETKTGSGALADYVEMVWITPATDGLFTGAASERRRFLDRLILCFDPSHRTRAGRFERAMAQRNRLLSDGVTRGAQLDGLEIMMAEMGIAIAAARAEAVAALSSVIDARRERDPGSPFPWSVVGLEGAVDRDLASRAAVDVEDGYARLLRDVRERDRGAGRALDGPHRSDLAVSHGPKAMAAKLCSTGEQKALLMGLLLAHAELVAARRDGMTPMLLLDEVTAHLDVDRRAALFDELMRLGTQAWMTGTDHQAFSSLSGRAQFWRVEQGTVVQSA
ncbi:MAG: DNA replication/repair protein RecF [Hyphomicrobium zavarzinii]|uniref:DNA replication/repair protein RecF n=1 Tax=Hyphomicrobium zavarzinii TaxID=48292 RepID=UPI001A485C24|nr:DNA replication/repair protein RecF [Hyphomicrobium zavarzinii]MBL8846277.1 DNA replication/repair protein RecF [Hyphomicrobium zavarzinii]